MGGITDGRMDEFDIKLERLRRMLQDHDPGYSFDFVIDFVRVLLLEARLDEQYEETCMPEYNEVNQSYAKRLIWSRRDRLEELRGYIEAARERS